MCLQAKGCAQKVAIRRFCDVGNYSPGLSQPGAFTSPAFTRRRPKPLCDHPESKPRPCQSRLTCVRGYFQTAGEYGTFCQYAPLPRHNQLQLLDSQLHRALACVPLGTANPGRLLQLTPVSKITPSYSVPKYHILAITFLPSYHARPPTLFHPSNAPRQHGMRTPAAPKMRPS